MSDKTKQIVRLFATDIDGSMPIGRALMKIKGISFMFSNAICNALSIDKKKKLGDLSQDEIKKIEELVADPEKFLPPWLLNNRKDLSTGKNLHFVGAKIDLHKREIINLLRKIRAYRGIRHELGLPVRGQRTRSSFRKNKTVGVVKKKEQPKKKKK